MVRVMATGVFDLLHPGHVYFLREARKLGDELWVVVARDSTARKFKHEPIMPESARFQMVEALKPVDRAVLGHEGNIYDILEEIRPDIIAIGYDQVHSEERILEECRKRGLATKVVRLPRFEGDLVGTRKIVRKVAEWLALQERLSEVERAKPRGAQDHPPSRRRKRNA
ncbi:MAG: FAD synthase [Methanobacteriota archaeon]|nr:MAG: FAD synthase [Euryarchaeota archaeon]